MQLLHDLNPFMAFWPVLSSIIAFGRWILQQLWGLRQRKHITITLKVASSDLYLSPGIRGKTQITFDNNNPQHIDNTIYALTLDVKNTGGQKITLSDYEPNTQLEFALGAKILEAEIKKWSRVILKVPVKPSSHGFAIDPLTLESKDFISVHLRVTDWTAKIEDLTQLKKDVQHIFILKPLSRINGKNLFLRAIIAIILCVVQPPIFIFITEAVLSLYIEAIQQNLYQALQWSLAGGGLIATLMSIAIVFLVYDIKPISIYAKKHKVEINKNRKKPFFAARHFLTSWLLSIIWPIFYFASIFIWENAFSLDVVSLPFISDSLFWGGLVTTILIVLGNIVLSWFFPLRELVSD